MEQQLPDNMKVLRLFGAEKAAVESVLSLAKENKGVKLQSMEQGAETLLLIEANTRSGAATAAVLNGWKDQVNAKCGDALYGDGETSLSQAMREAFLQEDKLFVCADAVTSAILEERFAAVQGMEDVYDFGTHSHAHPKISGKIAKGSSFAKKYPDQVAQQVAGQLKAAYQYTGADEVLSILPLADGSHLVFVGEKETYVLRRVPAGEKTVLWAVDMLRRAVLGKKQAKGTIQLKYGAALPIFALVERIDDQPEEVVAPDQTEFDAPLPPQPVKKAGGSIAFAVLFVLLIAAVVIAILYAYTGGDIASLWHDSGLGRFNVSSATLL